MSSQVMTIKLSKNAGVPWGFRLQGGKDFATPLCIQKVNGGSVASNAGLAAGDAIVSIAGKDALGLRHKEAQEAIIRAGNAFELVVQRGGQAWKPQVTPLAAVSNNADGVPVVTHTSLAATKQPSVRRIGANHNCLARPFPGTCDSDVLPYTPGILTLQVDSTNTYEEVPYSGSPVTPVISTISHFIAPPTIVPITASHIVTPIFAPLKGPPNYGSPVSVSTVSSSFKVSTVNSPSKVSPVSSPSKVSPVIPPAKVSLAFTPAARVSPMCGSYKSSLGLTTSTPSISSSSPRVSSMSTTVVTPPKISPVSNSSRSSSHSGRSSGSTSPTFSVTDLNISLNKEIAKNFLRMTLGRDNLATMNGKTTPPQQKVFQPPKGEGSTENLFTTQFLNNNTNSMPHPRKYSLASNSSSSSTDLDNEAMTKRNNDVNGQQIVNAQYNTPLGLYSDDNIAETLSAQAEVLGKGCLGINFKKYVREIKIPTDSPTYKLIHGDMENEPKKVPFSPSDKSSAPPPRPAPVLVPGSRVTQAKKQVEAQQQAESGYYNINEKLYCDVHAKQAARHNPPAANLEPVVVKPGAPTPPGSLTTAQVKTFAPSPAKCFA